MICSVVLNYYSVLTCLWLTLVLTGIKQATSTQLVNPRSASILLVIQQDLGRVEPV